MFAYDERIANSSSLFYTPPSVTQIIWRAVNERLTSPIISEILKVGFSSVLSVCLFAGCRSSPFQNISPTSSGPLAVVIVEEDDAASFLEGLRLRGRGSSSPSPSLNDAPRLLFAVLCCA